MESGLGDDDTGGGAAVPLTQSDAHAIAHLVRSIRTQTPGAGSWDEAGIIAALKKVKALHLAEVVGAAVRAAENPDLRTPAAIGNPGTEVWRLAPPKPVAYVPTPREEFCELCGKRRAMCEQISEGPTGDGHKFVPDLPPADPETGELHQLPDTAEARARARAELERIKSA